MKILEKIRGIDIYLLDQIIKGNLNKDSRILDAGCGHGRNIISLIKEGYSIDAIDPDIDKVKEIEHVFINKKSTIEISDIEGFSTKKTYDFIICNAVLHFAQNHEQFKRMIDSLTKLSANNGTLFIRMTSNFATNKSFKIDQNGLAYLPDDTTRYLLTEDNLNYILKNFTYKEPLKTVNVSNLRCMTTLVLTKI